MQIKPSRVAIVGADWPEYEKYCPNFTGMQLGLAEMGIEHKLFSCRPVLDIQALVEYQPDFIVYGLIDMVRAVQTRHHIRRALPDARIVMWYGDLRNDETGQESADMHEIDAMFISNDAQAEYYKRKWKVPSCHFLPLGSPVWDPPVKGKYEMDFIFIGTIASGKGMEKRSQIMLDLCNRGLKVIDAPAVQYPQKRAFILKHMPILYRNAHAVLDWSHFTDIPGYTSNRFWIITGSGGFALTKRWPGCTDFYPEGTRVYFDTPEEALELKEYYLNHPEEREKIRAAGHAHAIHHTYSNRFAIMFDVIYGKPAEQNRLFIKSVQA